LLLLGIVWLEKPISSVTLYYRKFVLLS